MAKKPESVLKVMTKTDFVKLNRQINDLESVAEEAAAAVKKAYGDKIKKRQINVDALKLGRKLQAMDNQVKLQSFLRDFDEIRRLYGWDDQAQLFEEDKTGVQKKTEAKAKEPENGKVPKPGKAAEKAKAESAKLQASANQRVGRKTEKKAVSRKALFDEGDDRVVN